MNFEDIKRRFCASRIQLKRMFNCFFNYFESQSSDSIYFVIEPNNKNKMKFARISNHHPNMSNYKNPNDCYNISATPHKHGNISIEFFSNMYDKSKVEPIKIGFNNSFGFEVETYVYDISKLTENDITKIINEFEKWSIATTYVPFKDPLANTKKSAILLKGKSELFNMEGLTSPNKI